MKVENNLPEPFIHNEYYEKMMAIINKAKLNPPEINSERHHIIPKSYYKKLSLPVISKNNIVKLSFAEHMLVHFYAAFCAGSIIQYAMMRAAQNFFKCEQELLSEEFAKQYSKEIEQIRLFAETDVSKKTTTLNSWLKWAKENKPEDYQKYLDNKEEQRQKEVYKAIKHIKINLKLKDNKQIKKLRKILNSLKNVEIGCKVKKPEYTVMCNETGKKYYSLKELAEDMKLDYKAVSNVICGYSEHKTHYGYSFSYCDPQRQSIVDEKRRKREEIAKVNIEKGRIKRMKGKKVIHLETGAIYNSMQHCNRVLNVHCETSCYSKNHVSRLGHFMFYDEYVKNPVDYKTLPTFEDAHKATTVYAQQKAKKKVRCIETGEIFNSCEDVRKKYGVRVDRCINPFTSKGKFKKLKYHFEYIKE